jgi:hypothetical protein
MKLSSILQLAVVAGGSINVLGSRVDLVHITNDEGAIAWSDPADVVQNPHLSPLLGILGVLGGLVV